MQRAETASELPTPPVADAVLRVGLPLRVATQARPLEPGMRVAGPVRLVRHRGSVDVFLEAIERATPGDVLVIDDGGRTDRGCIGDLTAIEALAGGVAGIIVWGCHRDSSELVELGLPVFSSGAVSNGPTELEGGARADPTEIAFGDVTVAASDWVFADRDGIVFVPELRLDEVLAAAADIRAAELAQATAVRSGRSLREQFRFSDYLARRAQDPSYTFRAHLRTIGAEIEE